jgi:hypothetical protein
MKGHHNPAPNHSTKPEDENQTSKPYNSSVAVAIPPRNAPQSFELSPSPSPIGKSPKLEVGRPPIPRVQLYVDTPSTFFHQSKNPETTIPVSAKKWAGPG